ncbi:ribosome silencing factor [uncultured Dysosmobacter sp.]|uniref:ribosome silencing factor n=1 Tax=uncultured Dysosmobacter sp. TaxID=2591384 RepID=UPI002622D1D7|nr:ribosome silencing factor [uncultured Dysosmobacter sp.]
MTPKELAIIAAKALDEKKGKEISAIEVTEQTTLADYFVIATGTSNTQINALSGAVEKAMKEQAGEDPLRREGYRDGTWVLLDYGCVVVHIFSQEAREFYSLERLWHDGRPVDLSGVLTAD